MWTEKKYKRITRSEVFKADHDKDVLRERFMSKIVIDGDSHWRWQGSVCKQTGYGQFAMKRSVGAHRASYFLFKGELKDGLVIDHICRVRDCVNPGHLRQVTQKKNQEILMKAFCKRGHERVGKGVCPECKRVANRLHMRRKRGSKLSGQ